MIPGINISCGEWDASDVCFFVFDLVHNVDDIFQIEVRLARLYEDVIRSSRFFSINIELRSLATRVRHMRSGRSSGFHGGQAILKGLSLFRVQSDASTAGER